MEGDTDRVTEVGTFCDAVDVDVATRARRLLVEVDASFRRCDSVSGWSRANAGCVYMSVSGPRRTLAKPYCSRQIIEMRKAITITHT